MSVRSGLKLTNYIFEIILLLAYVTLTLLICWLRLKLYFPARNLTKLKFKTVLFIELLKYFLKNWRFCFFEIFLISLSSFVWTRCWGSETSSSYSSLFPMHLMYKIWIALKTKKPFEEIINNNSAPLFLTLVVFKNWAYTGLFLCILFFSYAILQKNCPQQDSN